MAQSQSKLTPQRTALIAALLRAGNFMATAHAVAGVSKWVVRDWRRRGEAERKRRELGEPPKPELDRHVAFAEAVSMAEAQGEARLLAVIDAAARGSARPTRKKPTAGRARARSRQDGAAWQAAAWKLERTRPERFAPTRLPSTQQAAAELAEVLALFGVVVTPAEVVATFAAKKK